VTSDNESTAPARPLPGTSRRAHACGSARPSFITSEPARRTIEIVANYNHCVYIEMLATKVGFWQNEPKFLHGRAYSQAGPFSFALASL
jgi:hypothetical protein